MAAPPKIDPLPNAAGQLRAKYQRLCAKYAALVRRLEERTDWRLVVAQLGRWGLQTSRAGLALVQRGRMRLANRHFYEMAAEGQWLLDGEPEKERQPRGRSLRSLVIENALELDKSGSLFASLRLRTVGQSASLHVRMERTGHGEHSYLVLLEDTTKSDKRTLEMQRSREALLQQERLHMLGDVAGTIAHDLRTTLRSMDLQIQRLKAEERGTRDGGTALRALEEGLRIASETVGPLHDFAGSSSLEMGAVRLDRVVRQAAALVEMEARALGFPLRVAVDVPEGRHVRGSEGELSHLFLNLFNNARDAMLPKGGIVRVRARVTGGSMRVVVSDQGSGISSEHLPHLFEAFFTTKGARGTGLGLWLAANTMRRLGGAIEPLPRKKGAAFVLTLPLEEVRRSPAPQSSARGGSSAPGARPRRRAPRSG